MRLVEILKHLHPKLVEVHNYTARNSVSQKLINWETLNRKVLLKLGVNLSNTTMEQLAQSTPGAIEKVLLDVKKKTEELVKEKEKAKQEQEAVERETFPSALSGTIFFLVNLTNLFWPPSRILHLKCAFRSDFVDTFCCC